MKYQVDSPWDTAVRIFPETVGIRAALERLAEAQRNPGPTENE